MLNPPPNLRWSSASIYGSRGGRYCHSFSPIIFPRISCCLLALLLMACNLGCRSLRCSKSSDESISAARQLSLQGKDAQQKGNWQNAEQLYSSALQKCPKDDRARCGYAESLWQRGACKDAVAHMEEAVRLSGGDSERLVQLGRMYYSQGDMVRASQQAEKALEANRTLPSAWALQGDVERKLQRETEAVASYHRALSLQPHYAEVQLSLAEIYSQQSRPQRCLATLQTLAGHYPPGQIPTDVMHRQGLVLRQMGRNQDAITILAKASSRPNVSPDLLFDLAQTQMLVGDSAGARLAVANALQRDPAHPGSLLLREELGTGQVQMASLERPGVK